MCAKHASTSLFQRNLRIGYGRAAAILDAVAQLGLVGDLDPKTRSRPMIEKAYEFLEIYDNYFDE
jgi:DNA segregation ATPase FtsK/SpoIIIE, S-DNA-T family